MILTNLSSLLLLVSALSTAAESAVLPNIAVSIALNGIALGPASTTSTHTSSSSGGPSSATSSNVTPSLISSSSVTTSKIGTSSVSTTLSLTPSILTSITITTSTSLSSSKASSAVFLSSLEPITTTSFVTTVKASLSSSSSQFVSSTSLSTLITSTKASSTRSQVYSITSPTFSSSSSSSPSPSPSSSAFSTSSSSRPVLVSPTVSSSSAISRPTLISPTSIAASALPTSVSGGSGLSKTITSTTTSFSTTSNVLSSSSAISLISVNSIRTNVYASSTALSLASSVSTTTSSIPSLPYLTSLSSSIFSFTISTSTLVSSSNLITTYSITLLSTSSSQISSSVYITSAGSSSSLSVWSVSSTPTSTVIFTSASSSSSSSLASITISSTKSTVSVASSSSSSAPWSSSSSISSSSTLSTASSSTTSTTTVPTCTPTSFGNATLDDTPAIMSAFQSCGNGGVIVFSSGKTYSINSPLSFSGCKNCLVQLDGTLKVSNNLTYWNGRKSFIDVTGINNATIQSNKGTGLIDGSGQAYYDYFATDSSYSRPTLFYIAGYSTYITMSNIRFINAPSTFVSVTGYSSNCNFQNINMRAVSTSDVIPHNTDGMDIGYSTNITVNNLAVYNQDDCVAFKPGSDRTNLTNVLCSGSHGISVGSLGSKVNRVDPVTNIYVKNATMINSTKAVGIKLYDGSSNHGSAMVQNVTFDTVTVNGCGYAAQVQSCYSSTSAATCTANPSTSNITDIYFKNFSGTLSGEYKTVAGNLNCPGNGTCDLYFSNFNPLTPSGKATYLCSNIDNTDTGIKCSGPASG